MRVLLVCLALAACNNNSTDTMGDDTPAPDAPPGSGSITPQVGQWFYAETTPVSSSCPSSVSNGTGNFLIDSSSATMFRVVPGDGTAAFLCNLSGKSFECPNRAAGTQDLRPGIDAVLAGHAIANGTFASSTQASGRQELTVTCTGTQCGAAGASFPCKVVVDYVIRAR